jgi:hypothetical protein
LHIWLQAIARNQRMHSISKRTRTINLATSIKHMCLIIIYLESTLSFWMTIFDTTYLGAQVHIKKPVIYEPRRIWRYTKWYRKSKRRTRRKYVKIAFNKS